MTQSPLLHTFAAPVDIRAIRVTMAPPQETVTSPFEGAKIGTTDVLEGKRGNRLAIKIVGLGELDVVQVASVEEAEDHLFNSATIREVENVPAGQSNLCSILFEVNRSGSFIAMRTRRGAGNVVILGSKVAELLSDHIKTCDHVQEGRWTNIGKYNGMTAYVGEAVASNEAIVAYVNKTNRITDGPGGIAPDGEGYQLATIGNTESTLGNLADYIQRLVVTNL